MTSHTLARKLAHALGIIAIPFILLAVMVYGLCLALAGVE